MLTDKNFIKIKIYLDFLQYTSEEQKQIQAHNKGRGSSSVNQTRDIDQPEEDEEFPKWGVEVLLSKSNVYELLMLQNSPNIMA
jgi:hypothetical protein